MTVADSHYRIPYRNISLYLYRLSSENIDAPNLIFLPMTGSNGDFFRPFCEEMAKQGFQVWALDLMGHGRTSGSRGVFKMEDLIGNVQVTLDYIGKHSSAPIAVMGTHLGAEVAFNSVLEDSRIQAVICHNLLLASQLSFNWLIRLAKSPMAPVLGRWLLPWLELEKVFDHQLLFDDPELLTKFRQDPLRVSHYETLSYLTVFRWRPGRPLDKMSTPVLLMCGENGRLIPRRHQERIYNHLCQNGVKVQLAVFPKAGNQILLEHTTPTAKLAGKWLTTVLQEEERCKLKELSSPAWDR